MNPCFRKIYFLVVSFVYVLSFTIVSADNPRIVDFSLNGQTKNVTFNPNSDELVSISVTADKPVKFTRLYICSVNQACTGTSGNYTRYFTQSFVSDTISKSWNGKASGDAGFVPSGEYKVMVSMTEEGSPSITEFAPYSIFVDFSTESNTQSSQDSTDADSSDSLDNTESISTHSASEQLSDSVQSSKTYKINAGRERLTYVGFPLVFEETSNNKDGIEYIWSFGDGYSARGREAIHTYNESGEFVVVLNSSGALGKATARTNVMVLEPKIQLIENNGDIILKNLGKYEVNIGDAKIRQAFNTFYFAKDTILSPQKSIKINHPFSRKTNIEFVNPSGSVVSTLSFDMKEVEPENTAEDISKEKVDLLVYYLLEQNKNTITTKTFVPDIIESTSEVEAVIPIVENGEEKNTYEEPVKEGLFSRLVRGPKSFFIRIGRKFYDLD